MIARGLGVTEVPSDRADLLAVLASDRCVPAFAYDLTFADVFYPDGNLTNRQGFDVVLGNPPWDRMLPADKEFFAAYEFTILDAPTKRERSGIEKRILENAEIAASHQAYIEEFRGVEKVLKSIYAYQVAIVDGEKTIGKQDAFRAFMERNAQLLNPKGLTGVVVPSAFHANEGATGIRKLYLENMSLKCRYSFENKRKIFEIHSSQKFAVVIASRNGITDEFPCAFYLHDDEWLFADRKDRQPLSYTLDFVQKTGGEYLSLLELQSLQDLDVAKTCFANGEAFGKVCDRLNIRLGRELNMTDDSWRFTSTSDILTDGADPRDPNVAKKLLEMGYLILHEGKTFWHYSDRWEDKPRYVLKIDKLNDKQEWLSISRFYRLAFRDIASATNERTLVFAFIASAIVGNTAPCERKPQQRPNASALVLMAMANCFISDWTIRLKASSHVNLFILFGGRLGYNPNSKTFLAHSSLRLTCNHSGYEPLWHEQLGNEWREPNQQANTYPVLTTDDQRWQTRAAIDAVVAQAYGLTRDQYAHILSTFSHKSYPQAPQLCLAHFDELQEIGLENFTRKHDPYWDIPLNENLPKPVIELPIPTTPPQDVELFDLAQVTQDSQPKKRKKKAP